MDPHKLVGDAGGAVPRALPSTNSISQKRDYLQLCPRNRVDAPLVTLTRGGTTRNSVFLVYGRLTSASLKHSITSAHVCMKLNLNSQLPLRTFDAECCNCPLLLKQQQQMYEWSLYVQCAYNDDYTSLITHCMFPPSQESSMLRLRAAKTRLLKE